MAAWSLIDWNIFDFSSETAERIQRNWTGSKLSTSTKFMLFGPMEKNRWPPDLWLAGAFSTSCLKPLNGIWPKLTGSKISTFVTDRKTKMTARPLIGWCICNFSSETAERNSRKLNWKQDLNFFYQVFVFLAYRKTSRPSLWWVRHFRLLLWNRWTKSNGTWQ